MRVLVLDGNENQAVACVRSLARAGHSVFVGAETSWSKAGWSRHATGSFVYPAPAADAVGFVSRIRDEVARAPALVLPLTERSTLPLSAQRDTICAAGGSLVLARHERLLQAFDKSCTQQLAASVGFRTPRTGVVRDPAEARAVAEKIGFPVVVKARASEEFSPSGAMLSTGAPRYARNPDELASAVAGFAREAPTLLVQEFVPGEGAGYFALFRHGELRAEFAHRRIRDVRPTGSGSAVRVSVPVDPDVREKSLALLRALDWHGVAMIEYRIASDGAPFFLEVNGRFWNSLALAIHSGIDFPALLAEIAERGDVEPVLHYRTGVRCRWLLGDVRHLAAVWKGAPTAFPGEFPGRLATLARFLTPVRGTRHDHFEASDPLPALGDWVHFFFRRVPAALRSRAST